MSRRTRTSPTRAASGSVTGVRVVHGVADQTPGREVVALRLGDEVLGERAEPLRLRLGRGDATVTEQLGGQVAEQQSLVGRAAAEAGTLGGRGHGWYSSYTGG